MAVKMEAVMMVLVNSFMQETTGKQTVCAVSDR